MNKPVKEHYTLAIASQSVLKLTSSIIQPGCNVLVFAAASHQTSILTLINGVCPNVIKTIRVVIRQAKLSK